MNERWVSEARVGDEGEVKRDATRMADESSSSVVVLRSWSVNG